MNETLVTCVVPVFNGAPYLAEALDSALAQSHSNIEIIVVDDGSTDDSAAVAAGYRGRGVALVQQANAGCAAARNAGIRRAAGSLVAFLDADDVWRPTKVARQVALFEAESSLGSNGTLMQNFWIDDLANEAARDAERNGVAHEPQAAMGSTLMVRARALAEVGLLNQRYSHRDFQDWLVRAKVAGWRHSILNEVLVDRRIHHTNLSRQRTAGADELLDMASALLARKRSKA